MVKNPPASAGVVGLIPGLGSSPGEGNGNPLQYSCLGNPMDRGACRATVDGHKESDTTQGLNKFPKKVKIVSVKVLNLVLISEHPFWVIRALLCYLYCSS